jgi:hypothetical protein
MRRWQVVIEDPDSEFATPEELASMLRAWWENDLHHAKVALVRRGGLLADKVMEELPPVRHTLMGRPRG